jgi:uncharacterized protein DUF4395
MTGMKRSPQLNFVKQQGFRDATADTCGLQFPALMFQPRVVGAVLAVGILLQSPWVFLALSAVLWWSAALPRLNPFEAFYNRYIRGKGRPPLSAAPPPRRFAQALAAAFTLVIASALLTGRSTLAWTFEALLLAAVAALIFGAFCLGSVVFHLISGNHEFARRTMPWARS